MKTLFLLLAFCFISALSNAQISTAPSDSMIVTSGFNESRVAGQVSPENLNVKGQLDAATYYKKYKGAATGTLFASLLSPIVGLIPAIACSATGPKIENLDYPDRALFEQKEYYEGYTKKAKKIKSAKVWKNWAIGFGANLVAILIVASVQ